jgi:acyl-CoA thioester hydrolase
MVDAPYSGRFEAGSHRFAIRIYFEDTDAGGVVYHTSYLRFMERARSDMMRLAGIEQRGAMERGEGCYVVAGIGMRYKAPARLDDDLLVVSRIAKMKAATCLVHQRVMRGAEMLVEADISVALIGPHGRPMRQPRHWIETFERMQRDGTH